MASDVPTMRPYQTGDVITGGSERFEVLRVLGEGGMGVVYLARQCSLDRQVALKMVKLDPQGQRQVLARLKLEAQQMARLEHPHIAPVYNLLTDDRQQPFLVMAYIDGVPLSQMLGQPLSAESFFSIFEQTLSALAAVHAANLVHRDIKPSNIMVAESGAFLMDFGIAKSALPAPEMQGLTQTGALVGSPTYMAPEQCIAEKVDGRSDLYALGCVMYEALSGQPPFNGNTPLEVMYKHTNDTAPPLPAGVNPGVCEIVERVLSKAPESRFQSAEEMRAQLLECSAQPLYRAATGLRRTAKPAAPRKRRLSVPLAAALPVVALAAVACYCLLQSLKPPAVVQPQLAHLNSPQAALLEADRYCGKAGNDKLPEPLRKQALDQSEQAARFGLQLSQQMADNSALSDLYRVLGTDASMEGNWPESQRWFEKAVAQGKLQHDHRWRVECEVAYAEAANRTGQFEKAIQLGQEALRLHYSNPRPEADVAQGLCLNLCRYKRNAKHFQESLDEADEGLRQFKDPEIRALLIDDKAQTLVLMGRFAEAKACSLQAAKQLEHFALACGNAFMLAEANATYERLSLWCQALKDSQGAAQFKQDAERCLREQRQLESNER